MSSIIAIRGARHNADRLAVTRVPEDSGIAAGEKRTAMRAVEELALTTPSEKRWRDCGVKW